MDATPSVRIADGWDKHRDNYSWIGPGLKSIRHAPSVEVRGGSGYSGQGATTVKRLDYIGWYLLLSAQELIAEEYKAADA